MRHSWKAILIAAAVLATSPASVRADLLAYYSFEDGDGAVAEDSSGNDFHAELTDAAAFTDDGYQGGAVDFGEFNNGAAVNFPEAFATEPNGFNAIVESQEVTISFWLNRNGDDATDAWTFQFGGSRQLGSHAPWSNSNVYFDVAGCCGANQRINTEMPNDADTDGNWHHLAYVKKKNAAESDKAITAILQNGVPIVSSPGCDIACWSAGALDTGSNAVSWADATIDDVVEIDAAAIGTDTAGNNSHNGRIDEFAIWDEALEVEDIESLAAGGSVLPLREPLGDFNADGNVDTADFAIMAANFNQKFSRDEAVDRGDFNGDLRVNLKDFLGFRMAFNAPAGAAAAAVPEPATGGLLGMAGALLLAALRRRRNG